jgi:hypothetical protein
MIFQTVEIPQEKQLLAVLRHFAPVHELATAVLEVVLQGMWAPRPRFRILLQKIQHVNIVNLY